MKIGDKVRLLDEEGIFTIKDFIGNNAILIDSYGFEVIHLLCNLISYDEYANMYNDVSEFNAKKEDIFSENKNIIVKESIQERVIDLHIGNIVNSVKNLMPHQMLEKQINKAIEEIKLAKKDKVKKLIIIHGKGKGILKKEVYKILNTMDDIEYFEADIIKYRFGAVEIRFKF
ncbi:MAG: Smr/MutS family protein [Apibacter sp.]|jgi:dsDNA-specific endonuclease/ATPase MutS2|nr:Smr/MutS family protein [Apibacter sp.]